MNKLLEKENEFELYVLSINTWHATDDEDQAKDALFDQLAYETSEQIAGPEEGKIETIRKPDVTDEEVNAAVKEFFKKHRKFMKEAVKDIDHVIATLIGAYARGQQTSIKDVVKEIDEIEKNKS